ncbi:putative bifunctional diguanylate cyclase/phosphodiesterase [Kineococcus sp. SYSU DK006]|uniref:putative bifunctional diguanylate cyclase/phosphodiesterase n=1 Tax=Kineococcus sp. SYSU DK006 TaxID=3383127 RepID=UPI003D7E9216
MARSRPRLAPRTVLVLAGAAVAAQAAHLALPAWRPQLALLATAAAGLALVVALVRRTRRSASEGHVWRWFARGWAPLALAGAASAALAAVPAAAALAPVPTAAATLLTFPLLYRALVRWTRHNPSSADPDDVLNGVGAVLVVTALAATVAGLAGARHPDAVDLLLLTADCAAAVLVLSAATAARLSSVRSDPRVWLMTAGVLLTGAGSGLGQGGAGLAGPWAEGLWTAGLLAAAAAALAPVASVPTTGADPAASTVGAFVVVSASLVVIAVDALTGAPAPVLLCAVAAVACSATRLLINLRDLAHLATSRREALTDELTGAANRRAVLRGLDASLAAGEPVLVAVFDVDRFKEVNDGLGHAAGDDLLRMIVQRVQLLLGPGQLLGRLGGDEFALVCPGGSEPVALGQRVRAVLAEPFPLAGTRVHAGASLGVTTWRPGADGPPGPSGGVDAVTLLRRADDAMYDAKRNGLGVVEHDPARHDDSAGLLTLVSELRTALERGQLVLHYQPQLEVATGRLRGLEALVRWQHPVHGLLGPGRFVPLAEAHGLMSAVTDEVLEQAVEQVAAWRAAGSRVRVSVNLSASNLLDTALPARLQSLLERHGVPASDLVLEVTETVLLRDPERSLAVVSALRERGAEVSIDDFGTGYSSLVQLHRLPVSELKLDRSFTSGVLEDPRSAAIVAGTVRMAHDLGLRVVAEGVEDEPTLRRLAALGCDESQGFLHSRPVPAPQLARWLAPATTTTTGATAGATAGAGSRADR